MYVVEGEMALEVVLATEAAVAGDTPEPL